MKNRRLKLNNLYFIKVKINNNTNSNYTQFASLYKKEQKMPLLGLSFKNDATNEMIKESMLHSLQGYNKINNIM